MEHVAQEYFDQRLFVEKKVFVQWETEQHMQAS
jgi:hypothetical protein